MGKHAIEPYSDVLAAELGKFSARVSLSEPGNYESHITESMVKRFEERGSSTDNSRYKKRLERILLTLMAGDGDFEGRFRSNRPTP